MFDRCSHCGRKMPVPEVRKHEDICRNIVQCQKCGQLVDSCMKRTHDTYLCPESNIIQIECEWSHTTPFIESHHALLNSCASDKNRDADRNQNDPQSWRDTQRTGEDNNETTINMMSSEHCIEQKSAETEGLLFNPYHFDLSDASPECRTSYLESAPSDLSSRKDSVPSDPMCFVPSGVTTPARRRLFNKLGSPDGESVGDFEPVCRLSTFYER